MIRIDVSFLLLSVMCLLIGLAMGIGMGVAHDFQFAPVHTHLNLVGFVSLSVFGLTYKLYPALQRSRLALPHLAASGVGALVFPFGIYLSISRELPAIAIVGSLIVFAGVLLFAANLIWNVALANSPHRIAAERVVPWAA
jgi:cbb3-type cytochrome oxidase subunit 1